MSDWRPFDPSREAVRDARKFQPGPHPSWCRCNGEGWLWGHELRRPEPYPTDTRYSCDYISDDNADEKGYSGGNASVQDV